MGWKLKSPFKKKDAGAAEEAQKLVDVEVQVLEPPGPLSLRKYLSPNEREEIRGIQYRTEKGADIDLLADTYDYLMILTNPDNPKADKKEDEGFFAKCFGSSVKEKEKDKVDWATAKKHWLGISTFGMDTKDPERAQLQVLAKAWLQVSPVDELGVDLRETFAKDEGMSPEKLEDRDYEDLLVIESQEAKRAKETKSPPLAVTDQDWKRILLMGVVNVLSTRSGLQLKITISRSKAHVLIRIRAPPRLLENFAEKTNYNLQMAWEVDPGSEFWNEVELGEEQKKVTLADAQKQLDIMFNAQKLPLSEYILDSSEPPTRLKLKMNVLKRIADRVPVQNRFPAYCDFQPHFRHLYQTYSSGRGSSVFKPKDRLRLTYGLISHFLNIEKVRDLEEELELRVFALHDANRGDANSIHALTKRWVYFWQVKPSRVGAPLVSMRAMDEGHSPLWILIPFSQPLEEIKDYYGEKFGLYFAWIGFYCMMTFSLAVCTLLIQYSLQQFAPLSKSKQVEAFMMVMAVFMAVWTSLHQQLWAREQHVISIKWGTTGFEASESIRAQFEPYEAEPTRWNPVTNQEEPYYPSERRNLQQAVSVCVVFGFIVFLLTFIVLIYEVEFELAKKGGLWTLYSGYGCSFALAIQIQVLSTIYAHVSSFLNDWENHRTQTQFENALIFKTFLFQVFNNYASLIYTAFVKRYISGCLNDDCLADLQGLMSTLFLTQYFTNIVELGQPILVMRQREKDEEALMSNISEEEAEKKAAAEKELNENLQTEGEKPEDAEEKKEPETAKKKGPADKQAAAPVVEAEPFERELLLDPFESLFDDYAEMVLQYGVLCFFLLAFPPCPMLALIQNLMEIRVDAFKYCRLTQRPDCDVAENISMWESLMATIGWVSIIINPAIICFTSKALEDYDTVEKWTFFLCFEQILVLIKLTVNYYITPNPDWLKEVTKRQQFITNKYLRGSAAQGPGANVPITDADAYILEKSKELTGREFKEMKKKAHEIKKTQARIEKLKVQLHSAYESEVFNPETGIAETKTGFPLGCVSLSLRYLTGLKTTKKVKVVVSIEAVGKPTRGELMVPSKPHVTDWYEFDPEFNPDSTETSRKLHSQEVRMFPIGTKDAEIVLRVFQATKEEFDDDTGRNIVISEAEIGFLKVHLFLLDDQFPQKMILPVLKKTALKAEDTGMQMEFKVRFMYSKVLPLKQQIIQEEQKKKEAERSIFALQKKTIQEDEENLEEAARESPSSSISDDQDSYGGSTRSFTDTASSMGRASVTADAQNTEDAPKTSKKSGFFSKFKKKKK